MKQETKIKELEERIAFMDADNSALAADLAHWKKVAAGLKGNNKQLARQVEHYKALDKEGDEINESRIAMIEEKERVIKGLQEQVNQLANENKAIKDDNAIAKDVINNLKEQVKEMEKPWYKKIF